MQFSLEGEGDAVGEIVVTEIAGVGVGVVAAAGIIFIAADFISSAKGDNNNNNNDGRIVNSRILTKEKYLLLLMP
jgi:hypothetical protein